MAIRVSNVLRMFQPKSYMSRIFLMLLLTGCQGRAADDIAGRAYGEAGVQRVRLDALVDRVDELERGLRSARRDFLSLKPTAKEFGTLATDIGILAVSIDSVKALGNGSEVTVRFGNTTTASISKMSIDVGWGSANESDKITPHQATRELSDIRAGTWARKTIALEEVPPSKLGYITFRNASADTIALITE